MALSGELHFRLCLNHLSSDASTNGSYATSRTPAGDTNSVSTSTLKAVNSTPPDFRSFLNTDIEISAQAELFTHQLTTLQALKRINRIRNQHNHTYAHTQLIESLTLAAQELHQKVQSIHQRLSTEIRAQQGATDMSLMSSILQYNSLLQRELLMLRDGVISTGMRSGYVCARLFRGCACVSWQTKFPCTVYSYLYECV